MNTRTKEAIRYLGYGRHAVDDRTLAMVQEAFRQLDQVADPKIIYRIFELSVGDKNCLEIGKLLIESRNLYRNLNGCDQVILLGATLGIGVDMLMKRSSITDMAQAVVLQAAAAAMLEEYLDDWQEKEALELEKEGRYLRPRFSPGYGDFSIQHQETILRMLDTAKRIGLTMTESCMLTPTKSVTALIGISDTKIPCHRKGCESCDKTDCRFRRA